MCGVHLFRWGVKASGSSRKGLENVGVGKVFFWLIEVAVKCHESLVSRKDTVINFGKVSFHTHKGAVENARLIRAIVESWHVYF